MKIAYVSTYDARDVTHWSGSGYFIWNSLARRGVEVEFIGPLALPARVQWMLNLKELYHKKISHGLFLPYHDIAAARAYAGTVWQKLSGLSGIDAVVSPGTIPVACLPGTIPLVTVCDATHRALFNSYPGYENLCSATRHAGDQIERTAIRRAAAVVFASDWAAQSAMRDYQADPEKVHVVPFGANFDQPPTRDEAVLAINARKFDVLKLVFIGVEWQRKGGPLVMEVVRCLAAKGCRVHLTIVGCEPEISPADSPYVTVRGMIKKTPQGQKEICGLLQQSHFLIVPSEAECYGLVYCEAGALGVPCIARRVGGVPTIVRDEVNGRLFEAAQPALVIANWAAKIFSDPAAYRRMALSSRDEYDSRLNWTVAGEKLEKIIADAVARSRQTLNR